MAMSINGQNNDIILFFSSNALINVFISGKDINEWLLSLLGYNSSEDFSTLLATKQNHNGSFYLMIDGLDEHMFKSDQFVVLLNQVIDIFSFYQQHQVFKIVLTMRSATWLNSRYELEPFKNNCFLGFPGREDVLVNVPLFNNQEII
jgi:predicted NACHT family NTPase